MTNPVEPNVDPDEFAALRQTNESAQAKSEGLFDQLSNRISELDPRVVVGTGVAALGLVTIVGLIVLFSLMRGRSDQPTGTAAAVVVLTGSNPTVEPSSTKAATATLTAPPKLTETVGPSPTIDLTATLTNLPVLRFATLSEIKGTVQIRTEVNGDWKTVNETLTIVPGTTILTGEDSSVKVTLSEGSVVRLSSQTQFALTEMSGTPGNPVTLMNLDFGKLWAIVSSLGQGKFEVQLPIGVAAVRGSYMSAEHNSTDNVEIVTCLEGRCTYRNPNGRVELTDLQQTESINGGPPGTIHKIDANQLADWASLKVPEVLTLTPTATNTRTPTATRTKGPTQIPTNTLSPTPSNTPTSTNTRTNTPTATRTSTATLTASATFTNTPSKTPTATFTASNTPVTPPTNTSTATATATLTPTATATATTPPPVDHFDVSGFPTTVTAGSGGSVTVTAKDSQNNVITGYTGTIHFTSSDGQAFLPADITFNVGDSGTKVIGGIALKTAGSQSIYVNDTVIGSATGSQTGITVNPKPANHFDVTGPGIAYAFASWDFTVTARDEYNNIDVNFTLTVKITTDNPSATTPGDYTFTGLDAGVHAFSSPNGVTMATTGNPYYVTVCDFPGNTICGTSGPIDVQVLP